MVRHDDVAPPRQQSRCVASLLQRVRSRSSTPAVITRDRTWTWADLDDESRAFAGSLRSRGVVRGDRVAVFAENSVDVVIALLAHHRQGIVHVPINPSYQSEERAHVERDSGAKITLTDLSARGDA